MNAGLTRALVLLSFAAVGVTEIEAQSPYREPENLLRLVQEQNEPYVLVDVRSPSEFASGHIPTAVNIPVDAISQQLPTEDRAALVIVYCRSGARSARARDILVGLGFVNVVDFGSLSRWTGDLVRDSPGSR
jgi:phage shock protein E